MNDNPAPQNQLPDSHFTKLKSKMHRKQLLFLLPVLGLVVAAVAVIGMDSNNSEAPQQQASAFKEYLNPSSEIKVGEQRYVSACQVLTFEDVDSVYNLGTSAKVSEVYYDNSVDTIGNMPMPSCDYGNRVEIEADQYADTREAQFLSMSLSSLGADSLDTKIAAFEKAAESNDSLKPFVDELKQGADLYKRANADRFSQISSEELENKFIPTDSTLFNFSMVKNNVVYQFEDKSSRTSKLEEQLSQTPQQIAAQLDRSAKMMSIIKERANDGNLSQAPAPTVIGDSDRNGDTVVLEPCAVLSDQVYKSAFGYDANEEVRRFTLPVDFEQSFPDSQKLKGFTESYCERRGSTAASADTTRSTVARIYMEFPNSEAAAKKLVEDEYSVNSSNDTLLQTSADYAAELKPTLSNGQIGTAIYVMRVGSYFATVSITGNIGENKIFGKDEAVTVSRDEYVKLINSIADSVRENQKIANSQ